ncbi:homoserine kinase [Nesterenkonia flava]|uniref:Homoserine kinase n=1 Tax=Nesterenkonia flava TaxID=469799 RepID=A0ABU1FS61_9MICC|nr:homoserine kinase [Nesterenkonia flava]MDR5711479.1 homoserine kinase [Nesterenkonia flava]
MQNLGQLGQGLAPHEALRETAEPLLSPLSEPVSFRLRVPATSANLGPGYDSMGLALALYDEVTVDAAPRADQREAAVDVVVSGEGAETLPSDASHLVIAVVERILGAKGYQLPDLRVQAKNVIPHSRGLGSSAAAVACAVLTADQLIPGGLSEDDKLQIGSRLEGHPDNYVPALRGGVAVSWEASGGHKVPIFRTAALRVHPGLRTVVAIPNFVQSTQAARDLLPETVAHAEAAKNSSRAGLLVHALTNDLDLLFEATEDSLHQEFRRPAFPASMGLVDALRDTGLAAVISGAGPAVLVLTDSEGTARASQVITAYADTLTGGDTFAPRSLPLSTTGATVEAIQR